MRRGAKTLALLFVALVFLPMTAQAKILFGQAYPDAWFECTQDDECAVLYLCTDVGINKKYLEQAEKIPSSCDAASPHNPQAKAVCVQGTCNMPGAVQQK